MQSVRNVVRRTILHVKHSPAGVKYRRMVKVAFSDKYLLYTNIAISISLSTTGDVIEQHYEIFTKEIETWDKERTTSMAFSGMGVGVFCHYWYKFLDKVIHGRTFDQVVKKLLLDQLICSPVIITLFFAFTAILEESPIQDFTEEMRTKFWTLYFAEWVIWPPAQIINFYFLPTRFRVLYDNTISLFYDVYTSKVKHDKSLKSDKLVEDKKLKSEKLSEPPCNGSNSEQQCKTVVSNQQCDTVDKVKESPHRRKNNC